MSIYIIESLDNERLQTYRNSEQFADEFELAEYDAKVTSGVCENIEIDDGVFATKYWVMIENNDIEDNVTFSINDKGELEYASLGVEF